MADIGSVSSGDPKWQKLRDEWDRATKIRGYREWLEESKKIVRRYRDDRIGTDGASDGFQNDQYRGSRFNILWSNVQTLAPAMLAKPPKPVVERRYLDRDDVGRTASVVLERALNYEIDNGTFFAAAQKALQDRLLPGRGVVWVRYEPKFSPMPLPVQQDGADLKATPEEQISEEVAYECTPADYINWDDFTTSASRSWEEVTWIDKRTYMSRKQLIERFGKELGSQIPLDWSPNSEVKSKPGQSPDASNYTEEKRARIHETWNKPERKVYWWAETWGDKVLDEVEDPLKLEGFWPCPKPLYATLTNDTLVPVPDYHEYKDQADELDDLTNRIHWLTMAIKVAGVYDGSISELQRLFLEGKENELIGVDNMAEFMSKAGPNGMGVIWLAPIKEQVAALTELYKARAETKQTLYEITGISDIVRGQAGQGDKTATEQRIKGQFASMRLNQMQSEVARFCRDILRIMGEIIAEHYDPMTLYQISGFEQYAKEQWPPEPVQPPPPPQMGHNGGPPMDGMSVPPDAGMPPPVDPAILQQQAQMAAQQKAKDMFIAAVTLLKDDKLRGFRIDIETDSMVEADQQMTQESRTQLLGAISQFLPQAMEAGMAVPELKPLMARLLMFFLRGFKASRDIEAAFEQFIDDATKEAANPQPKPLSPEELKAQAEMKKQEMETQRMEMQAKLDQEKGMQELDMAKQKNDMEMARMQFELDIERQRMELEREKLGIEREKATMGLEADRQKMAIQSEAAERDAGIDDRAAARDEQIAERAADRDERAATVQSDLAVKTAKAKAAQASKPKAEARA